MPLERAPDERLHAVADALLRAETDELISFDNLEEVMGHPEEARVRWRRTVQHAREFLAMHDAAKKFDQS